MKGDVVEMNLYVNVREKEKKDDDGKESRVKRAASEREEENEG